MTISSSLPTQKMSINTNSVIVGVDVHKYSHTAVAMNPWGQEKATLTFSNDNLPDFIAWLEGLGDRASVVVALEDVNSYGVHLVKVLIREKFPIRYVPAILTERERKTSTKRHKSDHVDAKRVGRVLLTKYDETLPARESIATTDELEVGTTLDLLLMERRDLVRNQTMLKNQLHALLHQYYGDHYADQFTRAFNRQAVEFYEDDLLSPREGQGLLATSILRRLRRLTLLEEQIATITKEIVNVGDRSEAVVALYHELHGCGMITAAAIVAETTTIRRFPTKSKFATYAGVAPTDHSSGQHVRLHTNPFGNRRLNKALHSVALSQIAIKGDPRGKEYFKRKVEEGKTKLWALRCLKRQIANQVYRILLRASIPHLPLAV